MKTQYEFWNEKLLSLTPEQFEELCYDLIKSTGQWKNVQWRKGGSDKGRDIVADKIYSPDGINTTTEKWFFQCKRYSTSVPPEDISSAVSWADAERADHLVIISNNNLSNGCLDFIEKQKKQVYPKITTWTDKSFVELMLGFLHVVAQYFPNDVSLAGIKKPGRVLELVLNIPKEKHRNLTRKLTSIAENEPVRTKEILQLIDKEIIEAGLVPDENIKALLYQQFSAILASKNEALAGSYLTKALEISPKNKLAMHQLVFILSKQKKYADALSYCDKILEIDNKDKFAWNNKGSCLQALGKKVSAKRSFEKAIEIDANFAVARKNLAHFLTNQGDFVNAINVLIQAPDIKKNYLIIDAIGTLFKELGAFEQATSFHDAAIKQAPLIDELWNNKGVALEHASRTLSPIDKELNEQALICFQKVTELNPSKALGWANKSVCYTHKGDDKKAAEFCDKALKINPNEFTAVGQKAILLNKEGKSEEGVQMLDDLLKQKDNSANKKNIYRLKAILLREQKKYKQALKAIETGLKHSNSSELLDLKSAILKDLGFSEKSLKTRKESDSIRIRNKEMATKLIDLLEGRVSVE